MKEWDQFLFRLEQELGSQFPWLKKVIRFDAANLYLEAEDPFQISWFEEHIRPRLKGFVNQNLRPIKVHLGLPASKKSAPIKKDDTARLYLNPTPLDPEFTLANFVPSPSNLMPFRLISELKGSPPPFNPIYLFGPNGSGKTHLLHAAASQLQKNGKKVFFVKAEAFTDHVVQAIRLSLMQDFRKVYREIDALIIDDIHIFSRKAATQEEFFHTFNNLHTQGKLLLFSANLPPSQLIEIEPRLISRFEWGITLNLSKPDYSLILEKTSSLWNFPLTPELTQFLSSFYDPILALQALVLRSKGPFTLEIAHRLLSDLLAKQEENSLTSEAIVKTIAAHYGIRSEDLLGKSQMRECALPRQIAMYLCREKLKWPFQKIGQYFSRDHSTVMSSVKQMKKSIDEKNPDLLAAIALFDSK